MLTQSRADPIIPANKLVLTYVSCTTANLTERKLVKANEMKKRPRRRHPGELVFAADVHAPLDQRAISLLLPASARLRLAKIQEQEDSHEAHGAIVPDYLH
jgi:hypothetical protein